MFPLRKWGDSKEIVMGWYRAKDDPIRNADWDTGYSCALATAKREGNYMAIVRVSNTVLPNDKCTEDYYFWAGWIQALLVTDAYRQMKRGF